MNRAALKVMAAVSALTAVLLPQSSSWAQEWTATGHAQLSANYNDNILLVPKSNNPASSWLSSADFSTRFKYAGDKVTFAIDPRVLVSRYKTEKSLDHTERFLGISLQSLGEVSSNKFDVSGVDDTTMTSELGLTGLTTVNKRHRSLGLVYSGSLVLNDYASTGLLLSGSRQQYPDARGVLGLADYDYGTALWSIDYKLSPRINISLQTTAGKLSVINNSANNSTNYGATLGLSGELADRWKVAVSGGPSQVRSAQGINHGSSYNVSLTRASEASSLTTSVGRDIISTGGGVLARRDLLRFDWSKAVNDRVGAGVSASTTLNNYIDPRGLPVVSLRYREFNARLSWALAQTWTLNVSGTHSWQGQGDSLAKRNYASVAIIWNGLDRRLN